eukprot:TRINITY_DN8446_c0_g1_i3.p1 TRINITY_DN8446_c0_g1~~TRINITY_DN8446_c0_g1_i3.p1  ORF type:complete len:140 (-),score=25.44 TRINITY_DN8446_c0_g1_i3:183-602(-)
MCIRDRQYTALANTLNFLTNSFNNTTSNNTTTLNATNTNNVNPAEYQGELDYASLVSENVGGNSKRLTEHDALSTTLLQKRSRGTTTAPGGIELCYGLEASKANFDMMSCVYGDDFTNDDFDFMSDLIMKRMKTSTFQS